jgi:transcriptional regulator with XRE-family HTH domain
LERPVLADYLPRMSTILASKIKALRLSKQMNQTQFGELVGYSQGMVARWESGAAPKHAALMALADAAGSTVDEFLGIAAEPDRVSVADIPVVGYVGAGAAVYPIDDLPKGEAFDTVERPPFVKGTAVAVEVRGDSLVPVAEDGWRLIYSGERTIMEDEVLNRLCVVELIDGRMLVKRVVRGTKPQRYHLISTNAPMIEDVEIVWAAKVKAIVPS